MKTLLHFFDQMSNYTSNLGLKFWWWALETIIHRFYSEEFENKIFTRPSVSELSPLYRNNFRI
jgi:Na+-transporting NADH:ubiquinone oxidoreductase subunit NqrF